MLLNGGFTRSPAVGVKTYSSKSEKPTTALRILKQSRHVGAVVSDAAMVVCSTWSHGEMISRLG